MRGYYVSGEMTNEENNAKGKLKIEASNLSEFDVLLQKAEKEACQLQETLSRLRRFEFDIEFYITNPTSEP